jgi:uroporphyrin-III C-methyltransferase/precorrin-2 dehydrogenase/sirohydrochlorin ferrochelatase
VRADALGLPITFDVEGAAVLVIGEGEEADRKVSLLGEAGAGVEQVAAFDPALLDGKRMALLCMIDPGLAATVHRVARARGVLFWACDVPEHSDFALPAIARLGPARIAVSTSGSSPALAGRLRETIESALGERFARFVEALGAARERVRAEEPASFERRRDQLRALLDGFELELRVRYPDWFGP